MNDSQAAPSLPTHGEPDALRPVVLRGTGRGLEIVIEESAPLYSVIADLEARLAQSPEFFLNTDVTLHLGGRSLPHGGLAHLKAITDRYGLNIVRLESNKPEMVQAASNLQIPVAPPSSDAHSDEPITEPTDAARMVVGPLRSGAVIATHHHLFVIGDVNPGAEVRAGGNIVIIGALRGLAHAACGGDGGYILALRLHAQQLRIGPLIARAGESDSTSVAEVAYAQDGRIVVEPFLGKLPAGYAGGKR